MLSLLDPLRLGPPCLCSRFPVLLVEILSLKVCHQFDAIVSHTVFDVSTLVWPLKHRHYF